MDIQKLASDSINFILRFLLLTRYPYEALNYKKVSKNYLILIYTENFQVSNDWLNKQQSIFGAEWKGLVTF